MLENNEIWKDIKGYEGLYQVSNKGRVWSTYTNKCLKPRLMENGYYQVWLTAKNGKLKREKVHRLVAIAFIPNENNFPQVNHKDEDKLNNCVENLEWCDLKYNCNYRTRNERMIKTKREKYNWKPKRRRKTWIEQYDLNGNLIKKYDMARTAARELGIDESSICACTKGKYNSAGGYKWIRKEEFYESWV